MNTSIEKIRIVINYLFNHLSNREIAKTVKISRDTVSKIQTLLSQSKLSFENFTQLSNSELEIKLRINRFVSRPKKPQPDAKLLCKELESHKGLTMTVLWEEYFKQTNGKGVGYTRFCEIIRETQKINETSQIQVYYPGEMVQIDYSGDKVTIDLPNGEILEANIFVGVLPYSGLLFCYATVTQKSEDWIKSCTLMFDKIKGIPEYIVCDNAKALITKNQGRVISINPYFEEYLYFYNISVLPARKRKPKDKAKGENGVNIAQKQILMRMRNEKFSSLDALNERLEFMTDTYNRTKTKTFPEGRMAIFNESEKEKLRPLPKISFPILIHYETTVVPQNYHITYLSNYYSVPHDYIRKNVEIKVVNTQLSVYYDKKIIAQHSVLLGSDKISTLDEHKMDNHRLKDYLSKDSILNWAKFFGVNTLSYCTFIIKKDPNLYNNLQYLFNLRDWVNKQQFGCRLESALEYACKLQIQNLARLKTIIETQSYLEANNVTSKKHKNLRGAKYYKEVPKC